jgi:hypothetical protein
MGLQTSPKYNKHIMQEMSKPNNFLLSLLFAFRARIHGEKSTKNKER